MTNCTIWVIYSVVIKNYYVFFSNFPGVILCFAYCFTALSLLSKNPTAKNERNRGILEKTLLGTISFYTLLALVVGIILDNDISAITNILGSIALVANILYYGAPLSGLVAVVRNKDSSSLLLPMLLANLSCSTMWFFYGWIGLDDLYIYVPNVLGMLFATIGIVIKFAMHGTSKDSSLLEEQVIRGSNSMTSFDGIDSNPQLQDFTGEPPKKEPQV